MRVNVVYASREPNRAAVILEAMAANGLAVTVAQKSKEVLGLLANRSCELLLVGQRLVDEDGFHRGTVALLSKPFVNQFIRHRLCNHPQIEFRPEHVRQRLPVPEMAQEYDGAFAPGDDLVYTVKMGDPVGRL